MTKVDGFPEYHIFVDGKVFHESCNFKPLREYLAGSGYRYVILLKNGKRCNRYVHRLLAQAFLHPKPQGRKQVVDHINHNITDNRLSNLRVVTHQENSLHRDPNKKTSEFRGVHWNKHNKMWRVYRLYSGKQVFIGTFHDEHEATMAFETITDHELDLILKFRAELRALKKRGVNAVSVLKQLGLR